MGGPRHYPRRRGGGCLSSVAAIFILIILAVCVVSFSRQAGGGPQKSRNETVQLQITPLPPSAVHKTAYYTDGLGWIQNGAALETSLEKFYEATGVQPHVYLNENAMEQAEADSLYSRLFSDEGHFLLVVAKDWATTYILGDDAAGVLTEEIMELFWRHLDDCADSTRADEDVLTDAFAYTAQSLAAGASRSPGAVTKDERHRAGLFFILAIVIFLIVVVTMIAVVIRFWKNARQDRADDSYSSHPYEEG